MIFENSLIHFHKSIALEIVCRALMVGRILCDTQAISHCIAIGNHIVLSQNKTFLLFEELKSRSTDFAATLQVRGQVGILIHNSVKTEQGQIIELLPKQLTIHPQVQLGDKVCFSTYLIKNDSTLYANFIEPYYDPSHLEEVDYLAKLLE